MCILGITNLGSVSKRVNRGVEAHLMTSGQLTRGDHVAPSSVAVLDVTQFVDLPRCQLNLGFTVGPMSPQTMGLVVVVLGQHAPTVASNQGHRLDHEVGSAILHEVGQVQASEAWLVDGLMGIVVLAARKGRVECMYV